MKAVFLLVLCTRTMTKQNKTPIPKCTYKQQGQAGHPYLVPHNQVDWFKAWTKERWWLEESLGHSLVLPWSISRNSGPSTRCHRTIHSLLCSGAQIGAGCQQFFCSQLLSTTKKVATSTRELWLNNPIYGRRTSGWLWWWLAFVNRIARTNSNTTTKIQHTVQIPFLRWLSIISGPIPQILNSHY